jgi:hypothetical protein
VRSRGVADKLAVRVFVLQPCNVLDCALKKSILKTPSKSSRQRPGRSHTTGNTPISGLSKAKIALDKAMAEVNPEVAPWRLHDLRRTGVSTLARLGFDSIVADKLPAHQPAKLRGVAAVYQRHDFAKEQAAAFGYMGRPCSARCGRIECSQPDVGGLKIIRRNHFEVALRLRSNRAGLGWPPKAQTSCPTDFSRGERGAYIRADNRL